MKINDINFMWRRKANKQHLIILSALCILILATTGCMQNQNTNTQNTIDRESKIPVDALKITPEMDVYPPQIHSDEYEQPVPMPGPINTAGAEDSPFIPENSNLFFFFFTPDVRVPAQQQLFDNVTGIYVSYNNNGTWSTPERVLLQEYGKLALDGCECMHDTVLWFCSAREGYTGIHWFTAEYKNGEWTNWKNADFPAEYEVGELHFYDNYVYFHSSRNGSIGQRDIWVSQNMNGVWQEPENIMAVNTIDDEGYPFITDDGTELWFTRLYLGSPAIYRSQLVNGGWQVPELIVSQFAGEPTLDSNGNVYFVHHFYNNSIMLEADIYVAYRK